MRHTREPQEEPTPAEIQPEQPAATPPIPRKRASHPAGWDDPELFMPTLRDLERQVRRRPIGHTIQDICLDLAVVPGFCHSAFGNELFDLMNLFGGNVSKLMQVKTPAAKRSPRSWTSCETPTGTG